MAIVIQILARNNQVIEQHISEKSTVSIGRAFNNDVVLSDPYISPHHIQVEKNEAEEITLQDQHTLNGTAKNKVAMQDKVAVCAEDIFTIGKTRIRILPTDFGVPEAMKLSPLEEALQPLSYKRIAVFFMAIFMALVFTGNYFSTFGEFKPFNPLMSLLGMVVVIAFWPMLFAMVSRLRKYEAKLISQLSITFGFATLFLLYSKLANWLSFNFNGYAGSYWIEMIIFTLILGTLFWFNIFLSGNQSAKRRTVVAALMSIGMVGLLNLQGQASSDDFSPRPGYNNSLLPPSFKIATPSSRDAFQKDNLELFSEARKLRDDDEEEDDTE